jgi:hypothetical protein
MYPERQSAASDEHDGRGSALVRRDYLFEVEAIAIVP